MHAKEHFRWPSIFTNLQGRLVLGFLLAACLTGLFATVVGVHLITTKTIAEAERRIDHNIRTAELIYDQRLERLTYHVRLMAACLEGTGAAISELPSYGPIPCMLALERRTDYSFDSTVVADRKGRIVYTPEHQKGMREYLLHDSVARESLETGETVSDVLLMPVESVLAENSTLAHRVEIPAPESGTGQYLEDALVLRAASPIRDDQGDITGILVGSWLLSGDRRLVDRIVEMIYENERYRGQSLGTASIFQGAVLVAGHTGNREGAAPKGAVLSDDIYRTVVTEGRKWSGRSLIGDDWYIGAYIPLSSRSGDVPGLLGVGILEAKYRDMKHSSIFLLLAITFLGASVAFILSWRLGKTIIDRIRLLKEATDAIASGNLDYKVQAGNLSGLDMLDEAFNNMVASLKDRDERLKRVFQQMTKTERLAALGQIAAGVAHEINNPLGGILLYSNLILEELPEEKTQERSNVEKIIYQTNRCRQIVQNLLDFSRSPSGEMTPVQINRVIHTSLDLVKDQYMFLGVDIETELAENLPEVMGDQSRLEQVFLNLLVNAADAMEGSGRLSIVTKLIQRYAPHDESMGGMETEKVCLLTSTNTVKVTITDTGRGIDEAFLPHIFEPFFSTKDPGKGTGLGLSITYGIIKKHDGFIDAESTPGAGTTITIYLPALDSALTDSPD